MKIDTLEDIAQLLLNKKIPFSYDTSSVCVTSNQRVPKLMANYHSKVGILIRVEGESNPITKEKLFDIIENC